MERAPKFPCLVKGSGSYYMRVRVPKDLVPVLKKRELKLSLNTKDYREEWLRSGVAAEEMW